MNENKGNVMFFVLLIILLIASLSTLIIKYYLHIQQTTSQKQIQQRLFYNSDRVFLYFQHANMNMLLGQQGILKILNDDHASQTVFIFCTDYSEQIFSDTFLASIKASKNLYNPNQADQACKNVLQPNTNKHLNSSSYKTIITKVYVERLDNVAEKIDKNNLNQIKQANFINDSMKMLKERQQPQSEIVNPAQMLNQSAYTRNIEKLMTIRLSVFSMEFKESNGLNHLSGQGQECLFKQENQMVSCLGENEIYYNYQVGTYRLVKVLNKLIPVENYYAIPLTWQEK